jgi:hypothetical protein
MSTTAPDLDKLQLKDEGDLAVLGTAGSVLHAFNLLGTQEETRKAGEVPAFFGGPPQSVAVLEAGASAFSKWWAAGLGTAVAGAWTVIKPWWENDESVNHNVVIASLSAVTLAAVIGIAVIVNADLRSRAAAAVATVNARGKMAELAFAQMEPSAAKAGGRSVVALPRSVKFSWKTRARKDEEGWTAVLAQVDGNEPVKYLVIKGGQQEWAPAGELTLTP